MEPDEPILDPLVALAHLAAATGRIRLGTGVIILSQRNPLVLAKEGKHTNLREVIMLRGRSVQIRSPQPIQTHVDGELQTGRQFDITIRPGALAVMMPDTP